MVSLLCILCVLLTGMVEALLVKIRSLHRAADEISRQFAQRLAEDTNVGIDIATSDREMRKLAMAIDQQLRLLRKERIRYEQGDLALKDAVTGISHDLRTPLTAIYGYLDLLRQEDASDAVRRYLTIIENRTDALRTLAEELFRYSLTASIPQYEARETVTLNHEIEACAAEHYGALRARGITPEISLPDAPVRRFLSRTALARILENVLMNAVKYSDGDLAIALSMDGTITFRNHAKALDAVHIGRLFDRYYTVENGRNGTGLGLSIAKVLTEQMGGIISAAKEGDVFTVAVRFSGEESEV